MLVPILLSLFWAVCSTVLIRPYFWKRLIKRKIFTKDVSNKRFSNNKENELKLLIVSQIISACGIFTISLLIYLLLHTRYNFYGSILPIMMVLYWHWAIIHNEDNGKIKSTIIIIIAAVCLFFSITDLVTSYFGVIVEDKKEIPTMVSTNGQNEKHNALSSSTVASLFDANDESSGPVYSNGKFVYTLRYGLNGYGIAVIDENDSETARFIACNFSLQMSSALRQQYPFARIKTLNAVVSDDDVPFGKYAILSKPNLFDAPTIDKYILQNMLTGEFAEYTAETLPEFAQ